jgi:hypothetical protein
VSGLEDGAIKPPAGPRACLRGYTLVGRQVDVVETSRGCTFDCSFCSIIEMRGRNFHTYGFERVLADIRDARPTARGPSSSWTTTSRSNVRRFEALCRAIVDARAVGPRLSRAGHDLGHRQPRRHAGAAHAAGRASATCSSASRTSSTRTSLPARAGQEHARASTARPTERHRAAIELLHRHGMLVVGGLIVGNPSDTRESIEANLEFARRYVDYPYIQHPTPYPRTPDDEEFRDRGLIINERLDEYDGTTAVVRSEHLEAEEIEFMRCASRAVDEAASPSQGPWFAARGSRSGMAARCSPTPSGQLRPVPAGAGGRAPRVRPLSRHPARERN